jgi:hypothetical protein
VARPDLQPHPEPPRHDDASGPRGPVIQVATRCTSTDQFVEKFASFASEGALVLPASGDLAVGTEGRFAVLLRDRSVVMRGRCRVIDSKPAPARPEANAVRRTMLKVALLEMDESSSAVHRRLLDAQRPAVPLAIAPTITERTDVSAPRPVAAAPTKAPAAAGAPAPITARPPVSAAIAAKLTGTRVPTPKTALAATPPPISVRPMPAPRSQIATIRAPTLIGIAAQPRDETPMWSPRHHRSRIGESSAPKRAPTDPLEVTRIQEAPETDALRDSARVALPGVDQSSADISRSEPTIPVPHPVAPVAAAPPRPPVPPPIAPSTRKPAPPPVSIATAAPVRKPTPAPIPVPTIDSAPIGLAPTSPGLTPARTETRVPGAAFKLPANPLSDLGPNDLASFIDCTLYERSDADEIAIEEDLSQPVPAKPQPPPAPAIPPPISLAPAATAAAPEQRATAVLPANRRQSLVLRVAEPARKFTARAGLYVACVVAGLVGGRLLLGKPAQPPAKGPAVAAQPRPEPPTPTPVETPTPTISAVSMAMAAPAPPRPSPPAKPEPKHVSVVPELQAPKRVIAAASPPKPGECVARVVTEPEGVQVLWGEQVLGETPLAGAPIPCGAGRLTLRRDRYQSFARDMTAAPGTILSVTQRLQRPSATLAIGSSPANAEITINGQPQGATPKKLTVSRYQAASIKVTLAGYEPWTKTVYVREAETRIAMQLRPTAAK